MPRTSGTRFSAKCAKSKNQKKCSFSMGLTYSFKLISSSPDWIEVRTSFCRPSFRQVLQTTRAANLFVELFVVFFFLGKLLQTGRTVRRTLCSLLLFGNTSPKITRSTSSQDSSEMSTSMHVLLDEVLFPTNCGASPNVTTSPSPPRQQSDNPKLKKKHVYVRGCSHGVWRVCCGRLCGASLC